MLGAIVGLLLSGRMQRHGGHRALLIHSRGRVRRNQGIIRILLLAKALPQGLWIKAEVQVDGSGRALRLCHRLQQAHGKPLDRRFKAHARLGAVRASNIRQIYAVDRHLDGINLRMCSAPAEIGSKYAKSPPFKTEELKRPIHPAHHAKQRRDRGVQRPREGKDVGLQPLFHLDTMGMGACMRVQMPAGCVPRTRTRTRTS